MPDPELSGISIVAVGTFNPSIVHPLWLAEKGLLAENAAEHATRPADEQQQQFVVSPQVTVFSADWLAVQVTQSQAVFSTVETARARDLKDLAIGVFDLLPETRVNAVGINADSHWRLDSEDEWHRLGDRFAPKDYWQPLFTEDYWRPRPDGTKVGLRSLVVEAYRENIDGYVRIEVAPSVRVTPHGVFAGINAHYELPKSPARSTAFDAARMIEQHWDSTRQLESDLIRHLLEGA